MARVHSHIHMTASGALFHGELRCLPPGFTFHICLRSAQTINYKSLVYYCTILTKCSVMGHRPLQTLDCVYFCEILAYFGSFCLQMNSFVACHSQNLASELHLVLCLDMKWVSL